MLFNIYQLACALTFLTLIFIESYLFATMIIDLSFTLHFLCPKPCKRHCADISVPLIICWRLTSAIFRLISTILRLMVAILRLTSAIFMLVLAIWRLSQSYWHSGWPS
uniref:Uncharacterized protein n=1 Tax=Ixodes ricinus TaxID=34613 RepID=A0A6B0U9Y0_IXORI